MGQRWVTGGQGSTQHLPIPCMQTTTWLYIIHIQSMPHPRPARNSTHILQSPCMLAHHPLPHCPPLRPAPLPPCTHPHMCTSSSPTPSPPALHHLCAEPTCSTHGVWQAVSSNYALTMPPRHGMPKIRLLLQHNKSIIGKFNVAPWHAHLCTHMHAPLGEVQKVMPMFCIYNQPCKRKSVSCFSRRIMVHQHQ